MNGASRTGHTFRDGLEALLPYIFAVKIRASLVLALALSWGGCRKAQPSAEYASAAALYSSLYREAQDDAYASPRMSEVQALLARVSPDSRDYPAATELSAKISAGQARINAEATARSAAIAEALKPSAFEHTADAPIAQASPPAAASDAGAAQPDVGITVAELNARFGGCFQAGPQVVLAGKGPVESFELRDLSSCKERHPGWDGVVLAIENGKVLGRVRLDLDAGR